MGRSEDVDVTSLAPLTLPKYIHAVQAAAAEKEPDLLVYALCKLCAVCSNCESQCCWCLVLCLGLLWVTSILQVESVSNKRVAVAGAARLGPPVFPPWTLGKSGKSCPNLPQTAPIHSNAAKHSKFHRCGVQRVPIRCSPDPQWFMQPKVPHRRWLSMADYG
jgi:hypothetical protein